ncbi:MAG: hypothetical protein GY814_12440 [Gammaproteobacteria bacterium]|nr:hypothetical protein [Gammaproteobacteria bacterium]
MEAEIVSVTIERDVSRGNEKAAKDRAEIQTTQILAFEGRIARIEKQRAEALTRLEYVEGLFKDDRFQRLLGANPTLITLRMKKATAAMLLELENATTH